MAMSKLSKLFLGFILIIIAFIIIIINIPVKSEEEEECENSNYVANGNRIALNFVEKNTSIKTDELSINVLEKGTLKKIKYEKLNINDNLFYFDVKILKTDTLIVKLEDRKYKIYDFINEGKRQKAGKDRGLYFCGISTLKINSITDSLYGGNTISINCR